MVKSAPAEDTRAAILKVAGRLLQTRGFNGFAYAHVAEELNIKTAAVHYHFPSKAELGVALIHRYRDRYRTWMAASESLPAWQQLNGYLEIFEHFQKQQRACPVGVLQAEYQAIPTEMQQETRALVKLIFGWLGAVLERGRQNGEFTFTGPADEMAMMLGASMQGALLLSRSTGKETFNAVVRQLKQQLGGETA